MEFSRPEYWSGWPFPSPGDLPNPGIEPRASTWQADSLPAEPPGKPKNTGVGKPIPSPGDLPDPGIEPGSPALQADSLPAELPGVRVPENVFRENVICVAALLGWYKGIAELFVNRFM